MQRRRGQTGLAVALLGLLLPVGYFVPANSYYDRVDDLGWTEGGGFYVLVLCLVVVLVSELTALRLGIQGWCVEAGKATVGVAALILGALACVCLALFLGAGAAPPQ